MSAGVACYLMTFYHVRLAWLKTGSGGWGIDSAVFFKEAYPLLAGVVLISLISYFIVASAVRRYKFYLDSGQDYRSMISLAESIDDLTNPAQIARLSSYPELQSVLRSYGDQIREISKDLAQQDRSTNYDELLPEIESLLRGESVEMDATSKGARSAILENVRDHVEAHRAQIEELVKRVESERRSCARAALAYGRVMEAISGAGEGLWRSRRPSAISRTPPRSDEGPLRRKATGGAARQGAQSYHIGHGELRAQARGRRTSPARVFGREQRHRDKPRAHGGAGTRRRA